MSTKEYIIERAFRSFMNKGYDSVSITVLQQELEMSRGAMYRYFKSKDELFKEVVDRYLIGMLNMMVPQTDGQSTLPEMIEFSYGHLKKILTFLDKEGIETDLLNFTALMIQAMKHYPGIIERLKQVGIRSFALWKKALENSIAQGDVRSDIDVDIMAGIFANSASRPEASGTFGETMRRHIEEWKKKQEYLYEIIKA